MKNHNPSGKECMENGLMLTLKGVLPCTPAEFKQANYKGIHGTTRKLRKTTKTTPKQ